MSDGPPAGTPPPGQPPPPGGPGWGQPPPPQYYGGYPPAPQTEGTAVAILILSIAAWVMCPLIPAIVAVAMAPGARRTIAESGGRLGGETLVQVGVIVSWINIGVCGLAAVIVLIAFIALIVADAGDNNALQLLLHQLPVRSAPGPTAV